LSKLVNYKDYEFYLGKIMELDPKIKYVVVYDGKIHSTFRDDILGYYKQEEIESLLSEAKKIWGFDEKGGFRIGEPRFTLAEYSKENRITFPLSKKAIILVKTELGVYVNRLVDKIIEIDHDLEYNFSGFSTR
jgi:hypothetical protein